MEYTPHGDPIPAGFANAQGDWMPPVAATNEWGDPIGGYTNMYGDPVLPGVSYTERGDEVHNPYNPFETAYNTSPSSVTDAVPQSILDEIAPFLPNESTSRRSATRGPSAPPGPSSAQPAAAPASQSDELRSFAYLLGGDPETVTNEQILDALNGLAGAKDPYDD